MYLFILANHYVVRENYLLNCGWSVRWGHVICSNCFHACGQHYEGNLYEMNCIRIFSLEPVFLTNGVRSNILVKSMMINQMSFALASGDAITLREYAANPSGWPAGAPKKKSRRCKVAVDVAPEGMSNLPDFPVPSTSAGISENSEMIDVEIVEDAKDFDVQPIGLGIFHFYFSIFFFFLLHDCLIYVTY